MKWLIRICVSIAILSVLINFYLFTVISRYIGNHQEKTTGDSRLRGEAIELISPDGDIMLSMRSRKVFLQDGTLRYLPTMEMYDAMQLRPLVQLDTDPIMGSSLTLLSPDKSHIIRIGYDNHAEYAVIIQDMADVKRPMIKYKITIVGDELKLLKE